MWLEISRTLPADIDQAITDAIGQRQDREDAVWLDLSTGARVVLAANGGWRDAINSAFHAFYVSPTHEVIEISSGLLGGSIPFDAAAELGAANYKDRLQACVDHIAAVLGVEEHPLDYRNTPPRSRR